MLDKILNYFKWRRISCIAFCIFVIFNIPTSFSITSWSRWLVLVSLVAAFLFYISKDLESNIKLFKNELTSLPREDYLRILKYLRIKYSETVSDSIHRIEFKYWSKKIEVRFYE